MVDDTEWSIALQRVAAACIEEECSPQTVGGLVAELTSEPATHALSSRHVQRRPAVTLTRRRHRQLPRGPDTRSTYLAAAEAERLTGEGTKTSKEQVETLLALGRLQVPSPSSVPLAPLLARPSTRTVGARRPSTKTRTPTRARSRRLSPVCDTPHWRDTSG